MTASRLWIRRGLVVVLIGVACQQLWRHGSDYVFAERFAEVEPGKIYRGAWQQPWPMRRIIRDYKIKTVVAQRSPNRPCACRSASAPWPRSWDSAGFTSRSSMNAVTAGRA